MATLGPRLGVPRRRAEDFQGRPNFVVAKYMPRWSSTAPRQLGECSSEVGGRGYLYVANPSALACPVVARRWAHTCPSSHASWRAGRWTALWHGACLSLAMPPLLVFGHGRALIITGGRMDGCLSFLNGDAPSVGGQVSSQLRGTHDIWHNEPWGTILSCGLVSRLQDSK